MATKLRFLPDGGTIGVVSLSSPPQESSLIDQGINQIKSLGYKVIVGKHVHQRHGFLAGSDRERVTDLHRAFTDKRVDAVLCSRGGYGSSRLLKSINYSRVAKHAKPLIGFSDVTSLHLGLTRYTKLISIHGPTLLSLFRFEETLPFNLAHLLRAVQVGANTDWRDICDGYIQKDETVEVLRKGKAVGRLTGGNLTILTSLLGTPYFPRLRGKILFLEETNESPYRIDRSLTQLLLSGALDQVAGIAIGSFHNCRDPLESDRAGSEYRQSVRDVLVERLAARVKAPIVIGLPFGHDSWNAAIPIGGRAMLDGKTGRLLVKTA